MSQEKTNVSLHAGKKIVRCCILANAILFAVEYKDSLAKVCKMVYDVYEYYKNRNHESWF